MESVTVKLEGEEAQGSLSLMESATVKLEGEEAKGSLSLMATSDNNEAVERGNGPEIEVKIEVKIEVGEEGLSIAQRSEGGIKGGLMMCRLRSLCFV